MLQLSSKNPQALVPTDIVFQTPYWADVKSRLGFMPMAFDLYTSDRWGDVLVLLQQYDTDATLAYVPQGPEHAPEQDSYGVFLEELSESLAEHLNRDVAFIRYDLPWESPYAESIRSGELNEYPEARIREMRMNMGTRSWNLHKTGMDMTVASSLMVDLKQSEEEILARMKPKTRYNIGLALRKGVVVERAGTDMLPAFHDMYCRTARRNGFRPCEYRQLLALFQVRAENPGRPEILFLMARRGQDLLAGAIVAVSGCTASFLYGASSDTHKNLMAPYAMHWTAMRWARQRGCTAYDMGAVSPGWDEAHRFHGLYRFKTGFGGQIELRSGSWDYPLDQSKYQVFRNAENLWRYQGG